MLLALIAAAAAAAAEVVTISEVAWEPLNPARGDASPMAGTLWGDRGGEGPTGFLLKPVDGFESPPHIHNVTYRGVVIRGLIHNDDPDAAEMWMPAGSFWTQPRGESHITAARGTDTLAYIEIDAGPYLVRPAEEATDSGERPINMDASNVVWIDASRALAGGPIVAGGPETAFLWGSPQSDQPSGALLKLPAGSTSTLRGHGPALRAVVIQGLPKLRAQALAPGSHFSSTGESTHPLTCAADTDCILYLRTEGPFDVTRD